MSGGMNSWTRARAAGSRMGGVSVSSVECQRCILEGGEVFALWERGRGDEDLPQTVPREFV